MNNINKTKVAIFGTVAAIVAAISMVAVQADTSALTVTCAGSVTNNMITWTATSTGGHVPYAFLWSGDSSVGGSTGTSLHVTYGANGTYTAAIRSTDASSTVATSTCAATVTSNVVVTPPTPTSTLPHVNQPAISIGSNGMFLARGMTVTNVSSGSFQGTVWGITYTVNWSGSEVSEFLFRGGKHETSTNPIAQIAVGDEVGVAGMVSASNPFVVNAKTVRDYSITKSRPKHKDESDNSSSSNNGENNNNGREHNGATSSASATINMRAHMDDLLNQLHNLQNLFKGGKHSGENGNSNNNN